MGMGTVTMSNTRRQLHIHVLRFYVDYFFFLHNNKIERCPYFTYIIICLYLCKMVNAKMPISRGVKIVGVKKGHEHLLRFVGETVQIMFRSWCICE